MTAAAATRGLLLAALLPACAQPALCLAPPARPPTARAYHGVFERWTREGRVLSWRDMDLVLWTSATLRSEEFQQAFLARYDEVYRITDPIEQQKVAQEEAAKDQAGLRFLVRTAGHNWSWPDLTPGRGFWDLHLVVEGDGGTATVDPLAVEQVKSRLALEHELYGAAFYTLPAPFIRAYHVRFPRTRPDGQPLLGPGTRRVVLRIAGPHGQVDLVWAFPS